MSIHRMTIEIDLDDELFAEHDGESKPPPKDLREWFGGDLVRAFDDGLAEPVHEQIEYLGEVTGDE